MRKFRRYLSMVVTFPAAILFLIAMSFMAIGGAIAGEGLARCYRIIVEEYIDATRIIKARVAASSKR